MLINLSLNTFQDKHCSFKGEITEVTEITPCNTGSFDLFVSEWG